jgi:hypothetical protein
MVVPFPDQGMRTVTAVLASHRRLLRMASDEVRRRDRIELPDPRGALRPRLLAAGPRLAASTAIGFRAVSAH